MNRILSSRGLTLLGTLAIALASAACGGGSSPTDPSATSSLPDPLPAASFGRTLSVVSGSGQQGSAGETLSEPLQVRVTDGAGLPLAGIDVFWKVIEGTGRVDAPLVSIDGEPGAAFVTSTSTSGIAQAVYVVSLGRNKIRASTFFAQEVGLFDATGVNR